MNNALDELLTEQEFLDDYPQECKSHTFLTDYVIDKQNDINDLVEKLCQGYWTTEDEKESCIQRLDVMLKDQIALLEDINEAMLQIENALRSIVERSRRVSKWARFIYRVKQYFLMPAKQ